MEYKNVKCLWYVIPDMDFEKGLRRLYSDLEVNIMCGHIGDFESVEFYVEHEIEIPSEVLGDFIGGPNDTLESVVDNGSFDDLPGVEDDQNDDFLNAPFSDYINDVFENVTVEKDDDTLKKDYDLFQKDDETSDEDDGVNGRETSDGSEDDTFIPERKDESEADLDYNDDETSDEELADARRNIVNEKKEKKDSTYLVMTEDERNDMENEFIVETDSEISSDNDEDEPKKKKKNHKFESYNPKIDPKEIKFTLVMTFRNSDEFKEVVKGHGVEHGYDYKFMKNEKERMSVVCMNSTACPWRIWASEENGVKTFKITTINPNHMCSKTLRCRHLTAKWIATKYYTTIISNPSWRLEDMKAEIMTKYQLDVGLGTCSRARRKALNVVASSMAEHYDKIWEYRDELRRTNVGSTVEVYYTCNNLQYGPIFQRFYVCFAALKKGFVAGCRKVLGLDGCFLKGCMKGELLIAVGRDANNQMFHVAWGVVQVESKNSWGWFISHLIKDLEMEDGRQCTIISDQQKGLVVSIAQLLPLCEHRACARHVHANWSKNFRGKEYKMSFWEIATATNMDMHNKYFEKLKALDELAYNDLMKRNPSKWCKAYFETHTTCDSCENNLSEGFNGSLLTARSKPLIYMLEDLRMSMIKRLHKRREWMSGHWDVICPRIRRRLEANTRECRLWKATYNGNNKFQVDYLKWGYIIDIQKRTCSCREWQLSGIPCCHAIAGLVSIGKKVEDYLASCYKKEEFLKSYAFSIEPISGENNWKKSTNDILKPPRYKAMPGRPKKNRVKAPHEEPKQPTKGTQKMSRKGADITCSNCKQAGHNKRGCKQLRASNDEGTGTSGVQVKVAATSKKIVKPKDKGKSSVDIPRVYTKHRNEGRKKVPQVPEGEKRKRGRPRKVVEPKHDFCGLYVNPHGYTFYKTPGASKPMNSDTFIPQSQPTASSQTVPVAPKTAQATSTTTGPTPKTAQATSTTTDLTPKTAQATSTVIGPTPWTAQWM